MKTRSVKPYNEEGSRRYAGIVHARMTKCWWNALSAAFAYAKRHPGERVYYVEGFVYDYQFPLFYEHGWFETEQEVYDPTRTLHQSRRYDYVEGVRFEIGKDCTDLRSAKRNLPLVRQFGHGGMERDGYRQAYEEVLRYWKSCAGGQS